MDAPRVVVIGAGFGGLAIAIRLQARGYRVTLVERDAQPGGRARVLKRDGYTFDMGPTVITAPWLLRELWELAGRNVDDDLKLVELDPYYRIVTSDGRHFDYSGNSDKMRAEIARFAPGDEHGYDKFLAISKEIFKKGFEELGDIPFDRITDMLKVAPDLIRLKNHRSVYSMVAKHFKDEQLRRVMSFHPLLIGGNPFRASSIYALIHFLEHKWGVHWAVGGTGAIVAAMAKLFTSLGGELMLSTTAEEITTEGRRATGVRLSGGKTVPCDHVVSGGDVAWTYKHLLPSLKRRTWTDGRLSRTRFSMSLFVAYFGTTRRFDDVAHHTILLGPTYKELIEGIFEDKRLPEAEDTSLYLHRPTATDPSVAPPGTDACYVLAPAPNLLGDVDWDARGAEYEERVLAHLDKWHMPGLTKSIACSSFITPKTFEHELLSLHGAAFSVEPVLTQSAWFRPHNRSEELDNLYIVGAGTHPGAGMPGVMSSARLVDRLLPKLASDPGRDPIAGSHAR